MVIRNVRIYSEPEEGFSHIVDCMSIEWSENV